MSRLPHTLPLISTLALWGLLTATSHTAWGYGAAPTVRGRAALDVVVVSTGTNTDERCLNNGSGGLACVGFNSTGVNSFGIALGDVDGDGDADVVTAQSTNPDQRCLNDGVGGFTQCASFSTSTHSTRTNALGDLDGDGDLDVVAVNNGPNPSQRCLNNGSGGFTNCADFNAGANGYGVALGDVDGDGDLDIVVANNFQNDVRCLNDGAGGFTNCASFNTADNSIAVALGDLDGDSDLDLVLANTSNQAERRCLNDGSGGFTNCASFNMLDSSYGIALGDVDGDGDLDVVIANLSQVEQRCLNDGSGGFTDCASFNTADSSRSIALGDLDGDGDLDVALANNGVPDQRCLNNGAGAFPSCASFNTSTNNDRDIALGRLDSDGLSDVTSKFVGGVTTSNFGLQTVGLPAKPDGLMALYQFDAKYCNVNHGGQTLSNLRTRTVRVSQNNSLRFEDFALPADKDKFLSAPEWREGGIGAELVIPTAGQTFGYANGDLAPSECAVITYKFNLFSLGKYKFAVRLYGHVSGPDALPDSEFVLAPGISDDLNAVAAIELDLGSLQATTELPPSAGSPPTTTPGGTAPTPVIPTTLSFPAGTSNLPSRR